MNWWLRRGPLWCAGALLILASGCDRGAAGGGGAEEIPEAQRFGGTAVVAANVDLQSMNALASNETFSRMFQRDVLFMTLVRYDAQLQPTPWLAQRWDTVRVAPDTLALTLHLRPDVRWHDGAQTTAEDVRFTFQRVMDPAVASSLRGAFARYAPTAEVVDSYTVRFRLRPHSEFMDGWAQLPIMPRHLLESVPVAELANHPFGTAQPVGNGPFRFARRAPGQEWVFDANPDFPTALGGRPYLDRLVYRAIPDATTLLTETLTGTVDVYLAAAPEQTEQIGASPDVRLISAPSSLLTFIAWNGQLPLFDTPEERRALSMAIDRSTLVRALLSEHGQPGRSTVTPAHWSWDPSDPRSSLPYSQEGARRLLADAGWTDRDQDGILEDDAGRPFRFTIKTPAGNTTRTSALQIVQAQLREIGVDARPELVEGNTLIGQISGRKDAQGRVQRDYEAVVMGWSDSFRKDDSNLFHSRNLGGPFQITSFAHPRVDALLDTLGTIVDREQARPLWREYQALIAENAPETVLYYPNRVTAVRRRLQGVEADARGELVSVARWHLAPAK